MKSYFLISEFILKRFDFYMSESMQSVSNVRIYAQLKLHTISKYCTKDFFQMSKLHTF